MTIAQIVHDNEVRRSLSNFNQDLFCYIIPESLRLYGCRHPRQSQRVMSTALRSRCGAHSLQIMRIWQVMDECIRTGVSTSQTTLPGRLGVRRRAPMLYRRLMRG